MTTPGWVLLLFSFTTRIPGKIYSQYYCIYQIVLYHTTRKPGAFMLPQEFTNPTHLFNNMFQNVFMYPWL